MNQQSEHLSNAQIEEFGDPASGAGAETDEWVEQHLADCPSCRGRVLDFQRTRFSFLPDSNVNTALSSNCPSEEDLRNLAAGLCSNPIVAELTSHAAACAQCGPLLREYQEDFSDDVSPEEHAALAQLRSASPKWQQQKAREMLKPGPAPTPPPPSPRGFFSWKWIMTPVAAAAACALLALGIGGITWYARRDTPEKAEGLLAQAATERRNLEMQFPGAAHSNYKQTLSGDSDSLLNSPASLRQAATLIDSQLTKSPDNPKWLLLSARLNLLDWRYKPALASLDKIQDTKVIDSPAMRMTQALALYEQAEWEPERKEQSYGEIINLLGKTLQTTPDDPIALFNQALACEKIHAYDCAISDYERLLKNNDKNGWAAEAKDHLNRIKEKKTLEH